MLDTQTKRRIDSARDILVGKVPDPKSQVEMITMAMIYKFMDDMDNQAVEYGGNRSFFTGDYEKFAWTKLFDLKLSGQETLNLYADAISSFAFNPNLPQLFRDIFKNAYLPFRDPQTLKLFLKTINEFHYDHSEKLGDAFEYLLSVLGSQGDAGQFRTPRHIIDFMVEILDPKKGDTIADPACGTAGFLISSYKHILKQNTKNSLGDLLTPDERTKLMTQFTGYDISPDMVRLSLVNMYLHGFPNPNIQEYDTLTSEEKWDEYFDIILANPPFMTPKGGIRPHNRFSVQANKAEVLFTDYIAEHINPVSGKAAIVVPNGIVATTNKAYKELRKLLVNESLLAVISLPAGVFQPYSGVKTSVLILDKRLAKKTDKILFLKINNDGFDLGAQRRLIDKNDLPKALETIQNYRDSISKGEEYIFDWENISLTEKTRILESNDISLSAERYFEKAKISTDYPVKQLKDLIQIQSGFAFNSKQFNEYNGFPLIRIRDIKTNSTKTFYTGDYNEDFIVENGDLIIGMDGEFNHTIWNGGQALLNQRVCRIINYKDCLKNYISYVLTKPLKKIEDDTIAVTVKHISVRQILNIEIPLPPLEIQKEIVAEIEGYQKIIDGAKQVVENYKPTIKINPDWEMVELGEICKPEYGFTETAKETGDVRFIRITDIDSNGKLKNTDLKFVDLNKEAKRSVVKAGDLLVARTGATYGKTMIFEEVYPAVFASFLIRLNFEQSKILNKFYWCFAQSQDYINQASKLVTGGGQPQFNGNAIVKIQIPLPPLETQEQIISAIEEEQKIVDANKKLIEIFEQKIKDRIDEVWGVSQN